MLDTKMQVNTGALKNMMNRFFQRVDNVVYDLQTGGIGILNGDSSLTTLKKTGENYELTNAPFNVSMSIPAFAVRTELDKVKTGDMIISDRGPIGYVIEKDTQVAGVSNAAYKMLLTNGAIASTVIPVNTVFGKEGVMVIQALNLFGNGEGGMDALLPLMLMGQGNGNTNDLLPLMLMGGMGKGTAGGMNPMMMMALMGGLDNNGGAPVAPVAPVRGNARKDTWTTN